MSQNDAVLVEAMLKEKYKDYPVSNRESEVFEIFACEQAISMGELSFEEIENGVIGGGKDGGIDGIFVFLNGYLINSEDLDYLNPTSEPKILLWLVQAKAERSFGEHAIDRVSTSTQRLLDMEYSEEDALEVYSEELVSRFMTFRQAILKLIKVHPQIEIRFSYVTKGETSAINKRVSLKAKELESAFKEKFTDVTAVVEFLGASELWKRSSTNKKYTLELPYQECIVHETGYIALVHLSDFINFISADDGSLASHIFDWNVRDYEGGVEVNKEIKATLVDADSPEFWWLNNGITVICSKASSVGKKLSLNDVQIVNGLQTSHAIHEILSESKGVPNREKLVNRHIQMKIVETADDIEVRDKVIRATNRQTKVPDASLYATDDLQRKIETYFGQHGWFYDRRKNFHRNQGRPNSRIVSITFLAQSLQAMGFCRPDDARARPSSLIKNKDKYNKLFSPETPLEVYLWLAQQQKIVDNFVGERCSRPEGNNLKFYLSMLGVVTMNEARIYNPRQLRETASDQIFATEDQLEPLLAMLRNEIHDFSYRENMEISKTAKGSDFLSHLLEKLRY